MSIVKRIFQDFKTDYQKEVSAISRRISDTAKAVKWATRKLVKKYFKDTGGYVPHVVWRFYRDSKAIGTIEYRCDSYLVYLEATVYGGGGYNGDGSVEIQWRNPVQSNEYDKLYDCMKNLIEHFNDGREGPAGSQVWAIIEVNQHGFPNMVGTFKSYLECLEATDKVQNIVYLGDKYEVS